MGSTARYLLAVFLCTAPLIEMAAQCPARPTRGTVVQDPFMVSSQSGVLTAAMDIGYSVDTAGYTHYCYQYNSSSGRVEAPTFSLNPGDQFNLAIKDNIPANDSFTMSMPHSPNDHVCGDPGTPILSSTNVHFHGLNVPPTCHQDDVISTVIQSGSQPFNYKMQIPTDEPPGLYWYHPHIHGFTEFQVNGGAAGALIVNGMEKYRPEVAGLAQRVFVIRQQYLVPWIPGPYQLTLNYQVAAFPGPYPVIQMKPGEKQFWRVANATIQDFLPLQVTINDVPEQLQLIALDGYPLAQPQMVNSILVPPAGRAEFIVTAPPTGGTGAFLTQSYSTGPTGNPDLEEELGEIQLTTASQPAQATMPAAHGSSEVPIKFADLRSQTATTSRHLFFSEEFGGTNGPIQFYVTVDGQKQKVFEGDEKPVITTKVGAVEDWTLENRALDTHAFHIHQIHFMLLEVDGKPVTNPEMLDTVTIPYWGGSGAYHSVKVRMDFRAPAIAGTFVFHCHILLHEDLGMMHKIQVDP